jgi:hypothetical protein
VETPPQKQGEGPRDRGAETGIKDGNKARKGPHKLRAASGDKRLLFGLATPMIPKVRSWPHDFSPMSLSLLPPKNRRKIFSSSKHVFSATRYTFSVLYSLSHQVVVEVEWLSPEQIAELRRFVSELLMRPVSEGGDSDRGRVMRRGQAGWDEEREVE